MALQGEEPAPGDLIEIFRFGYEHWALYVGDGYVVHLTPPSEYPGADSSSIFSVLSSRGEVKKELLKDVVGGCRYRVNNKLDQKYKPLPVNKIISSAKEMVGKEVEYGVLNRNCEHFVTNLRYSIPRSPQAEHFKFMAWISLAAGTVATIGCIVKRMKQSQNHA